MHTQHAELRNIQLTPRITTECVVFVITTIIIMYQMHDWNQQKATSDQTINSFAAN